MTITLSILIITVAMFIWGRVRADIVALTALAALLVFGILTPSEALAGFSSPIVVMMIGLFVVGGAIMQTGLAKLTGNKLMALSRGNETITLPAGDARHLLHRSLREQYRYRGAHDAYHRELSGCIGHAVQPFPHAPGLCGQSRRNAHAHRYAAQPGHR